MPVVRTETKLALVGAGVALCAAAGLGFLRATHGSTGESHAEGWLPTVAIIVAVAAPGVLALVGVVSRRPVLYGAAGIACAPLIVVSIAAFPLVIPCVLLILAFAKAQNRRPAVSRLTPWILVGFPVPIFAGLWILITRTGQYTYNFPGGSESGEYFTRPHAALLIALVVIDVAVVSTIARRTPAQRHT